MKRTGVSSPEDRDLWIYTAAPRPFFDVPVYRVTEPEYIEEFERARAERLGPEGVELQKKLQTDDPRFEERKRELLLEGFGGPWQFNEIVGYVRLVFMGSQVRGHLYMVKKKLIIRTCKRVILFRSLKAAPELDLPRGATSQQIYEKLPEYLQRV